MVVDDEPDVLRLIKSMLELLGVEVTTISDSREAALRLETEEFDGLFLDVRMPNLDGFQLTKRVRTSSCNHRIPIVMMTGLNDLRTMREGFNAGITFFLGKPFTREQVQKLFKPGDRALLVEKRRCARLPFEMPVHCWLSEHRLSSAGLNISESGMLLQIPEGLDVGQEIELEYVVPHWPEPSRVGAKVTRKEPPDRVGLVFTNLNGENRRAVQGYMTGAFGN